MNRAGRNTPRRATPKPAKFSLTHEDLQRMAGMPGGIAKLREMRAGVQKVRGEIAEVVRLQLEEHDRVLRMLDLAIDGGLQA